MRKASIHGSVGSSHHSEIDDDAINLIIGEHLVSPDAEQPFGSFSHTLMGGAVTRDIYKWQESRQHKKRMRRKSDPDVSVATTSSLPRASDLREPGMFRRHFLTHQAQAQGKPQPPILTRNFIDFLVLYGFFGGDVYPSDMEDEDEFDDLRMPHSDEENPGEGTSLLRPRPSSIRAVKGTSDSKAFFMLTKAFVGTGVLFLPVI
jgi:proton-coupled amino acid transporter